MLDFGHIFFWKGLLTAITEFSLYFFFGHPHTSVIANLLSFVKVFSSLFVFFYLLFDISFIPIDSVVLHNFVLLLLFLHKLLINECLKLLLFELLDFLLSFLLLLLSVLFFILLQLPFDLIFYLILSFIV